ncbi:hypothetical protein D910_10410 [Dendroctonus ponderosae]|uniref:Glucose-methanol-choline oxidoreductase C-terminal domain-containing protein n=1 Tax=Dendroctonus ponderosae TaxID=77166 RepID=U4UKU3_DENPD|nr:hypothetical protein D910_10410 [Dendroctonus ponderosae]
MEAFIAGPPSVSSSIGSLFADEYASPYDVLNASTDLSVELVLLHQLSRGTVTLQSSDPSDYPIIDVNYFAEDEDLETLHPVGTTAMGTNTSTSVVSSELKVHGIDQLRVVDAGIMPTTVSGHTTAAVVMIAEKAADLIKADYGYVNNTAI